MHSIIGGKVRPNMALQPKVNGLPPLGLHFILAQSRQSVAFG
ncbi:MAG TPA: hypothetical protein PLC55_18560 [Zoogloea sp.]|nr:hypothetical protein [Zoogloea sp.]